MMVGYLLPGISAKSFEDEDRDSAPGHPQGTVNLDAARKVLAYDPKGGCHKIVSGADVVVIDDKGQVIDARCVNTTQGWAMVYDDIRCEWIKRKGIYHFELTLAASERLG